MRTPEERSSQIEFQKPDIEATTVERNGERLSGVSPPRPRFLRRKSKQVAFDEGIKLSRHRFRGNRRDYSSKTGSLKADQSLRYPPPFPPPRALPFPSVQVRLGLFINAGSVELPSRTFHLPFQRPSISNWRTSKRVINYSKLRNTAQTFRPISYRFLLIYSEIGIVLFGIGTSVGNAYLINN